jgi:hypothetical protein
MAVFTEDSSHSWQLSGGLGRLGCEQHRWPG